MNQADDILWTAGFFNERFPAPVSPLGWSLLGGLIEDIALREPLRYLGYPEAETITLTRLWHGHPYSNVTAFQVFYKVFPNFLMPEDAYRYFPDGDISLRKSVSFPGSLLTPRFVLSMLRSLFADPENFSPWHNYRKWARYAREHDRRIDALRARLASLDKSDPSETLDALRQAERIHRDLLRIHRWSLMHADLTYGVLRQLARSWVDRERGAEIAARLVAGAPNKTMEVDAALVALAQTQESVLDARINYETWMTQLSRDGQEAFREFLAVHGHRSFSLDIAVPTFADQPEQVLDLLKAMEKRDTTRTPGQADGSLPKISLAPPKQQIFDHVRSLAIQYITLRENQRYYWQKSLAISRRLYLNLADRLVTQGAIAERLQVFYAVHRELVDYFEGRLDATVLAGSISARMAEWRQYQIESVQTPVLAYPFFLRGDEPEGAVRPRREEWQGRAVSPGQMRGPARVVYSAQDLGRVERGEILVAPSTDPAWTPVFGKIGGLVLERGGVLSHGAVVAREYQIPAVAGIANIANEIQDGEWLDVDGSKGVVVRLSRGPTRAQ